MLFFYWLIAVMPLEEHWLWGHVLFGTFTVVKALGLVTLLVALYRVVTGQISLRCFDSGTGGWFLAFMLALGLAAIRSRPESMTEAWSHIFSAVSLFVTVLALVTSRVTLNRTLLVAIGAAGVASLYTIRLQRYYGAGFRGGGLSLDSNYYAMMMGLYIPLAFLWMMSRKSRWERLFCCGCLFLMLAGSAIAASRGGFLGLAAAFLYLIFRSKQRVRNLLIAGAVTALLLMFGPSSLLQRFIHPGRGDQFGERARVIAWKSGLRMIEAHPLAGVGLHNFKHVILQYEDPAWFTDLNGYQPIVGLAHNTYIELSAEAGLPGLLSFLVLLVMSFRKLEQDRHRAQRAKRTDLANIALGLQAGLVFFVVSALFLTAWWEKMLWLLIFLPMCLHRLRIRPNLVGRERSPASDQLSVIMEPECIAWDGRQKKERPCSPQTNDGAARTSCIPLGGASR